jgi:hypothetical protein
MKCITYGWAVFIILILTLILFPVGIFIPMTYSVITGLASLAILIYWLSGYVRNCEDGILGCPSS